MRQRWWQVGLAVVALGLVASLPAHAQTPNLGRLDRGLFGSGIGNASQSLTVDGNLGALYYEQLGIDQSVIGRIPTHGSAGQAAAGMAYGLGLKRLRISASAQSSGTYIPAAQGKASLWIVNNFASVNASSNLDLSRRTHLTLTQAVAYQPGRYAELFPTGFGSGFDPSLALSNTTDTGGHSVTLDSAVRLAHEISRRVSISADYGFIRRSLSNISSVSSTLLSHRAGAAAHLSITRNLKLRLGYRFSDDQVGEPDAPHYRTHTADIGLDYDRALTLRLSRHTTLNLGAGLGAVVDQGGRQHYRVLGNADLRHEMGRTWSSSLVYTRTMGFSEVFQQPVLEDTVRANLNGLMTRRLSFNAGVATSRGTVGFLAAGHGLVRTTATTGLQAAVSRNVALMLDYLYYRRDIEALVVVPPGVGRTPENQILRVSVNVWAPLFNRARRP